MADTGRAADILSEGFFQNKTFLVYQWERLVTYLSLEASLPKPGTLHQIFVACDPTSGKVLGLAEVDARNSTLGGAKGSNGPYMCNVAVAQDCQRRGIASALVLKCEDQVQTWYHTLKDQQQQELIQSSASSKDASIGKFNFKLMMPTELISRSLYLKVRESNSAAIRMYHKLGYSSIRQETEKKTGGTILVMLKQLPLVSEEAELCSAELPPRR